MLNFLFVVLGLNNYSDGDVYVIVSGVLAMCAIAGILSDFVMKPAGYGVVGNGIILFVSFVLAMIIFHEIHPNIQRADPFVRLSFGMSMAFCSLFAMSLFKKAITRTT